MESPRRPRERTLTLRVEINGLKSKKHPSEIRKTQKKVRREAGRAGAIIAQTRKQKRSPVTLGRPLHRKARSPRRSPNTEKRIHGAPLIPDPPRAKGVTSGFATTHPHAEDRAKMRRTLKETQPLTHPLKSVAHIPSR